MKPININNFLTINNKTILIINTKIDKYIKYLRLLAALVTELSNRAEFIVISDE